MAQIDRYTCEETIRRLDDYLDRELTPHELQLVNEHLEVCAMCASEYAFEARALRATPRQVAAYLGPTRPVGEGFPGAQSDPRGGAFSMNQPPWPRVTDVDGGLCTMVLAEGTRS
jgi:Putative zinc-finger